ncbi:MAG: hypothetical protein MUD00_00995 [Candidatus Pacebacteria bacterium]|jgi:protein tyrosine/serine phosphatase|nr:hypothetical protein [Candidatus Paceibacterota bacterium]
MTDISLIRNWHEKAKEDYFSRYVFEYLAFEAFLKKYKYSKQDIEVASGNTKERSYIQHFKNDETYQARWTAFINGEPDYKERLIDLINYLQREPMTTGNGWWNNASYHHRAGLDNQGKIADENDFMNVVEFWYEVRNNLFHADKNPDDKRDEKLVTFAYQTLSSFIENVLLQEMDSKSFTPAMWEDFEHRFFAQGSEVVMGVNGSKGVATAYELLFWDDSNYPVIFLNKKIEKSYIIDKMSFNLTNLSGDEYLLRKEWENIKRRANGANDLKKLRVYFKDIIPLLEDALGDLGI